ncbi:MAG: 3-dehydroquinate synthase [Firmicutes bacterium]|nr:3-dehydroquinate synthase [Bacillota bacterium]
MIKLTVNASRKYDVVMERGALVKAGEYIGKSNGRKVCIITDDNVDRLYGQPEHALWASLTSAGFDVYKYVFPGGEDHKNMSTVAGILEFLAEQSFTRSDLLLALGGGITGDVTGFTAATYLRGIEFIQVPTSFLAVVDSSVGGKTGVNLSSGKNLAGAFWQPSLVLFDPDVLDTLSDELKLDGMAEAIKAGIIADPQILTMIDSSAGEMSPDNVSGILSDNDLLTEIAAKAVKVKRAIVEEDERESGKRALLNLGHTAAHAIEKCSAYGISHGHAVAMGMAMISAAAAAEGLCEKACHVEIVSILRQAGFALTCPYNAKELTSAALHDKKRKGDSITLVIPESAGNCKLKKMPVEELEAFFEKGLI